VRVKARLASSALWVTFVAPSWPQKHRHACDARSLRQWWVSPFCSDAWLSYMKVRQLGVATGLLSFASYLVVSSQMTSHETCEHFVEPTGCFAMSLASAALLTSGAGVGTGVGQLGTLQALVSAECALALPPNSGATNGRERLVEPLPHDLVQGDHDAHEPTVPSMEHGPVLQLRVSFRYGHT